MNPPSNRPFRRFVSALGVLLFLSPWLVGLAALTLWPFAASLYWSFCRYDLLSPPEFIGPDHYARLWNELWQKQQFGQAVWNTGYYALVSVPLSIVLGVGLAVMLSWKSRLQSVYRTLLFLPSVVPAVSVAIVWMWLLDPRDGLVNWLIGPDNPVNHSLGLAGLPPQGWFHSVREAAWPPDWSHATAGRYFGSKDALALMSLWGIGNLMILYLAALQDIPQSLYEAAQLDGAGPLRRFWHITLPLLTPVIFFNLVMGIIQSLQAFTQVYLVSGGEGDPAGSLRVVSLHLFLSAFKNLDMGYASAMVWMFFILTLVVTWLLFVTSRRWVFYQGIKP